MRTKTSELSKLQLRTASGPVHPEGAAQLPSVTMKEVVCSTSSEVPAPVVTNKSNVKVGNHPGYDLLSKKRIDHCNEVKVEVMVSYMIPFLNLQL